MFYIGRLRPLFPAAIVPTDPKDNRAKGPPKYLIRMARYYWALYLCTLSKSSKKDTQLFEHKYLDKWKGPLATVATAIIPFRQVPRIFPFRTVSKPLCLGYSIMLAWLVDL